jgi:WD40-like Beta Propeller Repeat
VRRARTLARGLWTVPPIAVGCGLAVVSTPAAEAAFPGRNGVIVFANAWRELQLVTIRPDGSGIALLSRRGGIDPHWSPDGTRLIVSVSDHLYVMDARKDATRREVAPVGYDPSWTPDGRSIVYTAVDKQGEAMMFTVRADGTQRRRLFRFGLPSINDAELSPTGRWLVLIAPEELPAYELHLYVVGINGRGLPAHRQRLRRRAPRRHVVARRHTDRVRAMSERRRDTCRRWARDHSRDCRRILPPHAGTLVARRQTDRVRGRGRPPDRERRRNRQPADRHARRVVVRLRLAAAEDSMSCGLRVTERERRASVPRPRIEIRLRVPHLLVTR